MVHGEGASYPLWTPDGRYILIGSTYGGGILWTRADGAGKPQLLIASKNPTYCNSLTPDGKRLVYTEVNSGTRSDLMMVPLESDTSGLRARRPEAFLNSQFEEHDAAVSPDGRWVAYASDESGSYQVYVTSFPKKEGKWQISSSGGMVPLWSQLSNQLLFRNEDQIMAVNYKATSEAFIHEKPVLWSQIHRAISSAVNRDVDLAPDGKRVLGLMNAGEDAAKPDNHLVFLLNFYDELRRRAPIGGSR